MENIDNYILLRLYNLQLQIKLYIEINKKNLINIDRLNTIIKYNREQIIRIKENTQEKLEGDWYYLERKPHFEVKPEYYDLSQLVFSLQTWSVTSQKKNQELYRVKKYTDDNEIFLNKLLNEIRKNEDEINISRRKIEEILFENDKNVYENIKSKTTIPEFLAFLDTIIPEDEIKYGLNESPNKTANNKEKIKNEVSEASIPSNGIVIESKRENPNKGIKKRIHNLVKELNLTKSKKLTKEICNDVCKTLEDEGFIPNYRSVYNMLNNEDVNDLDKK